MFNFLALVACTRPSEFVPGEQRWISGPTTYVHCVAYDNSQPFRLSLNYCTASNNFALETHMIHAVNLAGLESVHHKGAPISTQGAQGCLINFVRQKKGQPTWKGLGGDSPRLQPCPWFRPQNHEDQNCSGQCSTPFLWSFHSPP